MNVMRFKFPSKSERILSHEKEKIKLEQKEMYLVRYCCYFLKCLALKPALLEYHSCYDIMKLPMPECRMFMRSGPGRFNATSVINSNAAACCLLATAQSQHQVQCALLLDVVVRQSSTILQLLASEDQSLLVGWDTLLVLNLGLHIVDGV